MISIVVPVYNEEESLPELTEWIERVMSANQFEYEVWLVDDGSSDNSWQVILNLNQRSSKVKGLKLQRNYGKSAALNTGFKNCCGQVVITMDADLQDSPDEIPFLRNMIVDEGYDMVSGWKKTRHDPISKTIPSKFFNFITRKLSGIRLHDFNCGLKSYRREVIENISVYGEMHRYIPVIAKWQGFDNIGEREVQHQARKYGVTKFGMERFIFGFLDLLSITFVSKFRKRPMHFFGTFGIISFLMGFGITAWLISEKVYYNWVLKLEVRPVVDQPLFFLALVALAVGIQLFLVGFLGEMINLVQRQDDYIVEAQAGRTEKEPQQPEFTSQNLNG